LHGNPLVAGFQEDLAPDDELKTSSRYISNVVLQTEPSSDKDVSKTALRPSSKFTDSLSAKSGTTSIISPSLKGSDQQIRKISGEPQRSPAIPTVTVDSSEEEVAGCGLVIRHDADISDDEQHKNARISNESVRCTFYLIVNPINIFS